MSIPYPITVVPSRYGGTYEGGSWLAFPCDPWEVPRQAFGDDGECAGWFGTTSWPVGIGWSMAGAVQDLDLNMPDDAFRLPL